MKRLVSAVLLVAPVSLYAAAHDSPWSIAPDAASCPAGTAATGGPSYAWNDGRFVFEGYICQSIYRGTTAGN